MCIILGHEKITFPINDILQGNFYFGGILFCLGQVCVGKILNLIFWVAIFSLGKSEILNLSIRAKFSYVFFHLRKYVWECINIFYLRAFSKYRMGVFWGFSAKLLNFGIITLILGVFIKHLEIDTNKFLGANYK